MSYLIEGFDDFKFFKWLYSPYQLNDNKLKFILKKFENEHIPFNIFFHKLIQSMTNANIKKEDIIKTLLQYEIINDNEINFIDEVLIFLEQQHLNKKNNKETHEKLNNILYQYQRKKTTEAVHEGYPLPDPTFGRPYINWLVCKHKDCNKKFRTYKDLIQHLKEYNRYTAYMHKEHENCNITPEYIMENNLTSCPSYICNESEKIFTSEELCEHFKILGIPPFWKPGMVIDGLGKKTINKEFNKIYSCEECVVCLDNVPEVIITPCQHHILCTNCVNMLDKCPICKGNINMVFPF